mmetsp:Transcript_14527/g.29033  ORF Transcript_14527/g.29033 Transcript_14527/m.29033 type:complete len:270 (+) Transcript_14527:916-1725(+)
MKVQGKGASKPKNWPFTESFSSNLLPHSPLKKTALTMTAGPGGSCSRIDGILLFVLESTHLLIGSFPAKENASASKNFLHSSMYAGLTSPAAHTEFATSSCTLGSVWRVDKIMAFTQSCTESSSPTTSCLSIRLNSSFALPFSVLPEVAMETATKIDSGEMTTFPGSFRERCLKSAAPDAVTGLIIIAVGACAAPAGPGTTNPMSPADMLLNFCELLDFARISPVEPALDSEGFCSSDFSSQSESKTQSRTKTRAQIPLKPLLRTNPLV